MKRLQKYHIPALLLTALLAFGGLSSCVEEIDKSKLYVFNGMTIIDFLKDNPDEYSDFTYILSRIGYDKILATYGTYTCFAPNNIAVSAYVDSLYNDTLNLLNAHNGMTGPGIEGLTDSLCTDIALYHLLYTEILSLKMNKGATFTTILGRDINTSIDNDGQIVINNDSRLYEGQDNVDLEMENGIVHKVSAVFTRSNNMISGEMKSLGDFDIFYQALEMTGLADTLLKNKKENYVAPQAKYYRTAGGSTKPCYTPEECKIGWTIFAESDEVLNKAGINDINALIEHAKTVYQDCAETGSGWYDYARNNGIKISTGEDYKNTYNALNMWVRYHIVKASISNDHLAYHDSDNKTAETPAVNFFETLLPNTLMKVTYIRKQNSYRINYATFNASLSDTPEKIGSESMHEEWHKGILIDAVQHQAANGYIHPIKGLLEYNQETLDVFRERIRVDVAGFFGEMLSNNLRHINAPSVLSMYPEGDKDGTIRIPNNYFDNFIAYNNEDNSSSDQTTITYLGEETAQGNAAARRRDVWEADELNVHGAYDCAFRLPPVPDGTYEIRLCYKALQRSNAHSRGMMQIFLGVETTDRSYMEPLDIPLDMSDIPRPENGMPDAMTGWIDPNATDDKGLETDVSMRYHGFMRAPIGMLGAAEGRPSRYANGGEIPLRRILATKELKQGNNWLRFKRVLPTGMLNMDFIELVPINVYDNNQYREDMF